MQQDLCVSLNPLVKLLVGRWRIFKGALVGYYERGFRSSRDDQITQISIVFFDIALPGAEREAFFEEFAE